MPKKTARHAAILEITGAHAVASQEDLRHRLARRGVIVTQATLSRDLRELGLVRVPSDAGARYLRQEAISDEAKPSLGGLLPQLFSSISAVGELVVLHTVASGAQPISEAIDAEGWPELLGTIAGENTILIICRSSSARRAVVARLTRVAQRA
jgi:transcriptional regulator of arginine metabolism